MSMNWYVIQTKPKKEKIAAANIRSSSIEVFFPKMETVACIYGRQRMVIQSLFPGYIFARFDPFKSYRLVNYTSGVACVLGFDGPSPVSDGVIDVIKRRVDKNCVVQKALHLKARDRVRVRTGPFTDLMGIFERWTSDEGRIRVLLNLLNYDAKVELHYSQVEKLSEPLQGLDMNV